MLVTESTKTAPRAAVANDNLDVVIVGAGFGGMYMTYKLREAGFSVQGIEAGYDVGGTWFWNRYPGARCDIPSLLYSYTFSNELADQWKWSEKYAPQPEILDYAGHVADRFNLRQHYVFETKVISAKFDESKSRWTIQTDRGDVFTARHCVMATGCLSVPKAPDFKGADTFKGESHITGRWPHEGVDFKNKRVAVIGTGSSAIQSTPIIAADAAEVFIFQRTPNFSLPAKNRPITPEELAEFKASYADYVTALRAGMSIIPVSPKDFVPSDAELAALAEALWDGNGLLSLVAFPNLVRNPHVNEFAANYVRDKIRQAVKDPELAEKLVPKDYPIGSKRACVDTNYYDCFNKDHVHLIDLKETPITEITETGVKTSAAEFAVDMIVYATGFDAMTGALLNIDIRGRDNVSLQDMWAEGPKTYLGLQVVGFPNLFTVTGPGSPSVLSNMLNSIETHVDWIFEAISNLRDKQLAVMEPTSSAQEDWVQHVNDEADQTLYPLANSWYIGANVPGKPRVFMPYVGENYKQRIDAIVAEGYKGFSLSAAS
jgi:cyclohexanone monooxygenase